MIIFKSALLVFIPKFTTVFRRIRTECRKETKRQKEKEKEKEKESESVRERSEWVCW